MLCNIGYYDCWGQRTYLLGAQDMPADNRRLIVVEQPERQVTLPTWAPDRKWRQREDSILVAAGFEPKDGGLWQKTGVLFGRGAALQYAKRELRDKGESNQLDKEA